MSKRRRGRRRQRSRRKPVDDATLRQLEHEVAAARAAGRAPSGIDDRTMQRLDRDLARAEQLIERQERAADAALADVAAAQQRIGPAIADLDRELGAATPRAPRRSLRARFLAWRRQRRHRKMVAKLDRALALRDLRLADQSSAALLALLTERIARISTLDDPHRDLSPSIEVAQHVVADCTAFTSRLVEARDSSRAEAALWRGLASTATNAGRPDLAGQADDRVRACERREREAATALEAYEAGRARLEDAVAQLEALARRL